MAAIKDLQAFLKNPAQFGIVPFWFLNHYPEEKVLRQQIRDMASNGVAGVMVHARNGLIGGYLNHHWEKIVSCIIDEAQKHDLKVWLYDELNFPSGSAGKKVLEKFPESRMQSLELVYESSTPPEETFDRLICFENTWLGFKIRRQQQYPDYLNEEVTTEFVRLSYRWYAERYGRFFGSVIPGEFADNACGNFGFFRRSIPWTDDMDERFFNACGVKLDEVLPSLFLDTEKSPLHRLLFWRFFSDLFLNSFVVKIEKECERNGIAATGHYCLEHGLSEHIRQIGDRFRLKQHQQLPGVDMLGKGGYEVLGRFPFDTQSIMLALTSSPAYFFHGSRVLCECFGLSLNWQMNPAELRRMTGTLCALGVDLFVPHGFYYSISGHRKRECIPDYYHNTMWDMLGIWSLFTARLSALTAHSRHIADTAMLYPAASQQAGMELLRSTVFDHGTRCNTVDAAMMKIGNLLVANHIPFEAINDRVLDSAEVSDGELLIPLPDGNVHRLRTVILPSVWVIEESSYRKLLKFAEQGGRIIGTGEKLSLVFTGSEICDALYPAGFYTALFADFTTGTSEDQAFVLAVKEGGKYSKVQLENAVGKVILREFIRKDGQYFALLHNMSREKISQVKISCRFEPAVLDVDTLDCQRVSEKTFYHDFEYGETLLLTEVAEELPVYRQKTISDRYWIPEIKKWQVCLKQPNALKLNNMTCSYSGIERSFKADFCIKSMPSTLGIALDIDPTEMEAVSGEHPFFENGMVFPRNRCRVKINGSAVHNIGFGTSFDHWIYEADILPLVKNGRNTIELIQHCAYFETNNSVPEPFMLTGNFGVQDDALVSAPEWIEDTRWDNTVLKHYSGLLEYSAKITIPPEFRGRITGLELEKVCETAEVIVNGVHCGKKIMPPWNFDIAPDLTENGELSLRLLIRNTPANRWEEVIPSGFDGPVRLIVKD